MNNYLYYQGSLDWLPFDAVGDFYNVYLGIFIDASDEDYVRSVFQLGHIVDEKPRPECPLFVRYPNIGWMYGRNDYRVGKYLSGSEINFKNVPNLEKWWDNLKNPPEFDREFVYVETDPKSVNFSKPVLGLRCFWAITENWESDKSYAKWSIYDGQKLIDIGSAFDISIDEEGTDMRPGMSFTNAYKHFDIVRARFNRLVQKGIYNSQGVNLKKVNYE